jgi:hypothetical protein
MPLREGFSKVYSRLKLGRQDVRQKQNFVARRAMSILAAELEFSGKCGYAVRVFHAIMEGSKEAQLCWF